MALKRRVRPPLGSMPYRAGKTLPARYGIAALNTIRFHQWY